MAEGIFGRLAGRGHQAKPEKEFEVALSDEEWRRRLSLAAYHVLREHGTERAGTSPLDKQYGAGIYHCAGCGQPVVDAGAKLTSGTGWPSFAAPLHGGGGTPPARRFFLTPPQLHSPRSCRHL